MPPLINNGTVVHSYFYTNYATTPRSLKIWESTLQSCFPLKFVFLVWPPLPLQLFFLTNYLFILFVAGWYTFKRMNDALIPTLGLILVLWMENPIKGNGNFCLCKCSWTKSQDISFGRGYSPIRSYLQLWIRVTPGPETSLLGMWEWFFGAQMKVLA